jgi:UDP-glucose 4-epimerase
MDIAGSKLMLIGGAGLVGSHLAERLIDEPVSEVVIFDNFARGTRANLADALRSRKVRVVEGSISDRDALRRELRGIDAVFLLASLWLGECVNDPRSAWQINTIGTWNVIEACLENRIKRVVYSSSASVYGNAIEMPMSEAHPLNNRTMYGATKIANEQMFRAAYDQHGLPYLSLRYMNIYGPRMDDRGVYVSVIMKVLDRIMAGEPPVIFGDGSQTYDFVYVDDAADANVLAMKAECADEAVNIGTGVGTTIRQVVEQLIELSGSHLKPVYHPEMRSFVTQRVGTTAKAERLLAFHARTSVTEGFRRVVAWRSQKQTVV